MQIENSSKDDAECCVCSAIDGDELCLFGADDFAAAGTQTEAEDGWQPPQQMLDQLGLRWNPYN